MHAAPREVLALPGLEDRDLLPADLQGIDGASLAGIKSHGTQAILVHSVHEALSPLAVQAFNADCVASAHAPPLRIVVGLLGGRRHALQYLGPLVGIRPMCVFAMHLRDLQCPSVGDPHGAEDARARPMADERRRAPELPALQRATVRVPSFQADARDCETRPNPSVFGRAPRQFLALSAEGLGGLPDASGDREGAPETLAGGWRQSCGNRRRNSPLDAVRRHRQQLSSIRNGQPS
mmetsp:Transcript_97624/g.281731  ORF Transcript_97624/g.281731 Transcript_97624/m.281731 type:complete len:236 (-) Transcript_97624:394-1101(-)